MVIVQKVSKVSRILMEETKKKSPATHGLKKKKIVSHFHSMNSLACQKSE